MAGAPGGVVGQEGEGDEQELDAVPAGETAILAALDGEGGMLAQGTAIRLAGAGEDEADADRGALGEHAAGARIDAQHGDLTAPLREDAEALHRQARLSGKRQPGEILRRHVRRLVVARLGIDDLALVGVLPDRLEAVLVAPLPGCQRALAREDAVGETAE